MKCPVCPETDLVMSERQGVEIDYCPRCRGVWLDRGELDKIVDRANQWEAERTTPTPAPPPPPPASTSPYGGPGPYGQPGVHHGPPPPQSYRRDDSVDEDYRDFRYQKKRKPFWLEIFD